MFLQPWCRRRVDFVPASIESFWRVQVKRLCPDDFKTVKKRQNRMFHADPKKNAHISKRWFLFSDQKHPHPPVTSQNISSIVFLIQPFPRFSIFSCLARKGFKSEFEAKGAHSRFSRGKSKPREKVLRPSSFLVGSVQDRSRWGVALFLTYAQFVCGFRTWKDELFTVVFCMENVKKLGFSSTGYDQKRN